LGILTKIKGLVNRNTGSDLEVAPGMFSYDGFLRDRDSFLGTYDGQAIDNIVIRKSWDELRSSSLSSLSNTTPGILNPTVTSIQAIQKYRSWVYPCVNLIQRKAAAVDYYLYEEIGKPNDDEFNKITEHPAIKLLRNPNRFMTGRFLKQVTTMFLDLCGCAFWLKVRNAFGQPVELHPLNPYELVKIELGDNTNEVVKSFVFAPQYQQALRKEYPASDIVYFHYPNPMNPMIPFTPLQALAHVTDLDLLLQVYEKDFFQNNARPDFVIVSESPLNKIQAERLAEGWSTKHRGPGKQHRPAILSRNVRIEQLGMSAKDFEFMALSDWTKNNILAAYQVPEAMLGLYESFNKASSIAAETTFVKNCLEPRLFLFEDVINLQLLHEFSGTDTYEFRHESALPKDDEWEVTKNQTELTMGLTTVNAIRKKDGKQPFDSPLLDVPWINGQPVRGVSKEADQLWDEQMMAASGMSMMGGAGAQSGMAGGMASQMGMMGGSNMPSMQGGFGAMGGRPPGSDLTSFVKQTLASSNASLSTLLNAARGSRGGLSRLVQSSPEMYSFGALLDKNRGDQAFTKFLMKGIYEYIEKDLDPKELVIFKEYEEMIAPLLEVMDDYSIASEGFIIEKAMFFSDIVKKNIDDIITKGPDEAIRVEDVREGYVRTAFPFAMKALKLGSNFALSLVRKSAGTDYNVTPEEVAQQSAGVFLSESAELRANSVRKSLTSIIRHGIKQGLGVEEVSDLIQEKFGKFGARRAAEIARTELAGASDVGADYSFEMVNKKANKPVVKRAVFWTSLDERVCDDPRPGKNCHDHHGKVMKDYTTGEVFIKSAVLHPNCRCVRVPEF
jgi:HK97 family phage portal protein